MQTKRTLSPIGKKLKRRRIFSVIISTFISLFVLAAFAFAVWFFVIHQASPIDVGENSSNYSIPYFPFGDKTPEHLAQVLGSQEAYEKLANSGLRRIEDVRGQYGKVPIMGKEDMYIVSDASGTWVCVMLEGEIVDFDLDLKKITIGNRGEEIVLAISKFIPMDKMIGTDAGPGQPPRYIPWGEMKVGDWLNMVTVLINANRAEVRDIYISSSFPIY